MSTALALVALVSPLLAGPSAARLHAGEWPAGVLLAAVARLGECPVLVESATIGNTAIALERDLVLAPDSLPAIASLLLDSGIALVPLSPGDPRAGWLATGRTEGVERPIPLAVEVVRLEYADAEDVARILNEIAEAREADLPPGDIATRFIADPRTASIVVRGAATRIAEYSEICADLDRPPRPAATAPVLRTYRPERGRAESLRSAFESEWTDRGGAAVTLVVPEGQNILLVRCTLAVWEEVEPLLREIDRARPDPL